LEQQQVSITLDTLHAAPRAGIPQLCIEGVSSLHSGYTLWQSRARNSTCSASRHQRINFCNCVDNFWPDMYN
jgi:hypothetical protein